MASSTALPGPSFAFRDVVAYVVPGGVVLAAGALLGVIRMDYVEQHPLLTSLTGVLLAYVLGHVCKSGVAMLEAVRRHCGAAHMCAIPISSRASYDGRRNSADC